MSRMTTDLKTVSDRAAPDPRNPALGQTGFAGRSVQPGAEPGDGARGVRGLALTDPQQVLAHPALGRAEKRQLLASWASDACAVDSLPNWRRLPETGALVPVDDILAALQALDRETLH